MKLLIRALQTKTEYTLTQFRSSATKNLRPSSRLARLRSPLPKLKNAPEHSGGEVTPSYKSCGQSRGQRLDVRHADAGHEIVARTGGEGAVVSAGNVAEAGAAGQRIDQRVEERKRRLAGVASRFIQQGAESSPGGSA